MTSTKEKLTDCEGIGPATADDLIDEFGSWRDICDDVDGGRVRIARMDGYGPESAVQIQTAIEESDHYPPEDQQLSFGDW
jgi:ERCC4-type nuclease